MPEDEPRTDEKEPFKLSRLTIAALAIFAFILINREMGKRELLALSQPAVDAAKANAETSLSFSPLRESELPSREEFLEIREAAENDDPESQLYLGVFHANGQHLRPDFAEAAVWYGRAAENGNVRAMYYLGLLHELGLGVKLDYGEAFRWYRMAAEKGDAAAHLGIAGFHFAFRKAQLPRFFADYNTWRLKALYLLQRERDDLLILEHNFWDSYNDKSRYHQNEATVAQAVRERAEAGDREAQLALARLHLQGQGVVNDLKSVSVWVAKAVENGNPNAMYMWSGAIGRNDLVDAPRGISSDGYAWLEKAYEVSREPFYKCEYHRYNLRDRLGRPGGHVAGLEQLVREGYTPAAAVLLRDETWNTKRDPADFFLMARRSALGGDTDSQVEMIDMLAIKPGIATSFDAAMESLKSLAHLEDPEPISSFAYHWRGYSHMDNSNRWVEYLRKKAGAGDVWASLFLGIMLPAEDNIPYRQISVVKGEKLAYLLAAARGGIMPAYLYLFKNWDGEIPEEFRNLINSRIENDELLRPFSTSLEGKNPDHQVWLIPTIAGKYWPGVMTLIEKTGNNALRRKLIDELSDYDAWYAVSVGSRIYQVGEIYASELRRIQERFTRRIEDAIWGRGAKTLSELYSIQNDSFTPNEIRKLYEERLKIVYDSKTY